MVIDKLRAWKLKALTEVANNIGTSDTLLCKREGNTGVAVCGNVREILIGSSLYVIDKKNLKANFQMVALF